MPGTRSKLRWVSDIIQSIEVKAKKINKIVDMKSPWKVNNQSLTILNPFSPFLSPLLPDTIVGNIKEYC